MEKSYSSKAKLTLLAAVSAVVLLSVTGVAYADSSTAPGQQWTVGTRVYNGNGYFVFHTTHATTESGVIAEFSVPSSAVGFTDYLWNNAIKSLPSGGSITAEVTVQATGAAFVAGPWGSSDPTPSAPAIVYLFFQANLPTSGGSGCLPGYNENNYWWSAVPVQYTVTGSDTFALTAPLSAGSWFNLCGHPGTYDSATAAGFASALANTEEVGLAFGGGAPSHFGANGIGLSAGTATFQLNSYTISP